LLQHAVEDGVAAPLDGFGPRVDVEVRRLLGNTGQGRCLREGQLPDRLVEVAASSGLEAVVALAQIGRQVAVKGQDLLFAQLLLELDREEDLLELAPQGLFSGQKEAAGNLHGDRGETFGPAAFPEIDPHRPEEASQVDAPVLEEAGVLDRDHRVAQPLRQLALLQQDPVFVRVGVEELLVAIVEGGDQPRGELVEGLDLRPVNRRRHRDPHRRRHQGGHQRIDGQIAKPPPEPPSPLRPGR